jgi:2-polyprenyl-3-methyl-5-hydroxy-6-metoxy-1,4-benzoquinol methylase
MMEPTLSPKREGGADEELRFGFGANWRRFLDHLDEERIADAGRAIAYMLGLESLAGRSFLDAGSGSGLSSLAAMRLGSGRVHSFDYDADSVACTAELKRRYFADADSWTVESGDATDAAYVESLGPFDVVYSWGVLHHTGDMWNAIGNAVGAVRPDGGLLFIALYNDQGRGSRIWLRIKRLYNRLPRSLRPAFAAFVGAWLEVSNALNSLSVRHPTAYFSSLRAGQGRGMRRWHDLVDWVGGYPFEVAKPDRVLDFCRERGLTLIRMRTVGGGFGCNEFVFRRDGAGSGAGAA